MKLPEWLNRRLSEWYLRRRNVKWSGELPLMNMLRPPKFRVCGKGELVLGSRVKFLTDLGTSLIHVSEGAKVVIGDRCVINSGAWIHADKEVVIGKYVLIGPGAFIMDSDMHPLYPGDDREPKPIRICQGSWLCAGVSILPGVTLGENTTAALGSVVKKSVPSEWVVAGNPAEPVKDLSEKFRGVTNWIREDN